MCAVNTCTAAQLYKARRRATDAAADEAHAPFVGASVTATDAGDNTPSMSDAPQRLCEQHARCK